MIQVLSVEMSATQGRRTFAASSGNRSSSHVGSLTMKKSRALPYAPHDRGQVRGRLMAMPISTAHSHRVHLHRA